MTRSNTTILAAGFLMGMASLPGATADVRFHFHSDVSAAKDDVTIGYRPVGTLVAEPPPDAQVDSDLDAADSSNQFAERADSNGHPLQGDSRRPLREAKSANERFELRVEAGRPKPIDAEPCKATLLDNETKRPVWERNLVNDVAPSFAAISDDGKFVITLDEFRRGGARNALVIYSERGELLRHFLLQDLLKREDWKAIKADKRSINWLDGATYEFIPDPPQFVLSLKSGSDVRIDLKKLRVLRERGEASDSAADELPPSIASALYGGAGESASVDRGDTGGLPDFANMTNEELLAFVTEFLTARQAVPPDPELTEMLRAISGATGKQITVDGIQKGGVSGAVVRVTDEAQGRSRTAFVQYDDGNKTVDSSGNESIRISNDAGATFRRVEILPPNGDSPGIFALVPDPASAVTTDLMPQSNIVPQPDPQNPVNYVAWFNETTRFQGDPAMDAAPLYKQALSNFTDFAGDSTAYAAALDGKADGLQTPEIQQWLESNREAMDQFREAARLPGRSFDYHSEDGSLIGILLPDLSSTRSLVKGVAIEGKQLELAGRGDDAALAYLDIASAGAHQTDGATLIENLVGTAMQSMAADALMDLPAGPAGDSVDYAALAEQVEQRFQPAAPLADKINMERAMYLQTLQDMYMVDSDTGAQMIKPDKYQEFIAMIGSEDANPLEVFAAASQGMDKMVADGNRYYDRMVEAARMPYAEGRQQMDAIATELDQSRSTNPLLSQLVPALGKAHESTTRAEARRRAANLVTRLHAYKQQNGDFPDSLDVFGDSAFAIDPFTGGRFNYQKYGDQVRLYSEGEVQRGDANSTSTIKPYWPRKK